MFGHICMYVSDHMQNLLVWSLLCCWRLADCITYIYCSFCFGFISKYLLHCSSVCPCLSECLSLLQVVCLHCHLINNNNCYNSSNTNPYVGKIFTTTTTIIATIRMTGFYYHIEKSDYGFTLGRYNAAQFLIVFFYFINRFVFNIFCINYPTGNKTGI